MKNIFFLIIFLPACFYSCKTSKPATQVKPGTTQSPVSVTNNDPPPVNFSEPSTWVLGYFTIDRLTRAPYSSWYDKGYNDYQFDSDVINKLQDISKDDLTIKIVMGTWCPDSRREVPRFERILDIWQFPSEKVTYIGVDDTKNAPVGEFDKLNIQRVPTFIIYKNNIEAGRIIENPTTSLEQDMVNILTRNE
jgi:thiol-disulfide isomerase/thioredoxin